MIGYRISEVYVSIHPADSFSDPLHWFVFAVFLQGLNSDAANDQFSPKLSQNKFTLFSHRMPLKKWLHILVNVLKFLVIVVYIETCKIITVQFRTRV